MGSFPITSRAERSTGLLDPSVFHTPHATGVYARERRNRRYVQRPAWLSPLERRLRQFRFTMTRETRRPHRKRLRVSLPLLHAPVLFGFPRQVSNRLKGLFALNPSFLWKESTQEDAYAAHQQMPAVTHLCGQRRCSLGRSIDIGATSIPAHDLDLRMGFEPGHH